MSGGAGYRRGFIEMGLSEAKEFVLAAAEAVERKLHGGQDSHARKEIIHAEIQAEFDKRASYP